MRIGHDATVDGRLELLAMEIGKEVGVNLYAGRELVYCEYKKMCTCAREWIGCHG